MAHTQKKAVIVGLLLSALGSNAFAFTDQDAVRVIGFARSQLADTVSSLSSTQSPKASRSDGTWSTVSNTDRIAWTQSFFPGAMWMMFQVASEPLWRDRADRWTRPLEIQKTNTETHDTGEKIMYSFGQAYRLTGNPFYRDVALTGAGSLASLQRDCRHHRLLRLEPQLATADGDRHDDCD
jgi:unsaturated chondroitin disaccharide hydrolase